MRPWGRYLCMCEILIVIPDLEVSSYECREVLEVKVAKLPSIMIT